MARTYDQQVEDLLHMYNENHYNIYAVCDGRRYLRDLLVLFLSINYTSLEDTWPALVEYESSPYFFLNRDVIEDPENLLEVGDREFYFPMDPDDYTPIYGTFVQDTHEMWRYRVDWKGIESWKHNHIMNMKKSHLMDVIKWMMTKELTNKQKWNYIYLLSFYTINFFLMPCLEDMRSLYNIVQNSDIRYTNLSAYYHEDIDFPPRNNVQYVYEVLQLFMPTFFIQDTNSRKFPPVDVLSEDIGSFLYGPHYQDLENHAAVPQVHTDDYPLLPPPALDMEKYHELEDIYNSRKSYQGWFGVIYSAMIPNREIINATLWYAFPDCMYLMYAPCKQRVSHVHFIIICVNSYTREYVTERTNTIFAQTRNIKVSPLYSRLNHSIEYIERQLAGEMVIVVDNIHNDMWHQLDPKKVEDNTVRLNERQARVMAHYYVLPYNGNGFRGVPMNILTRWRRESLATLERDGDVLYEHVGRVIHTPYSMLQMTRIRQIQNTGLKSFTWDLTQILPIAQNAPNGYMLEPIIVLKVPQNYKYNVTGDFQNLSQEQDNYQYIDEIVKRILNREGMFINVRYLYYSHT